MKFLSLLITIIYFINQNAFSLTHKELEFEGKIAKIYIDDLDDDVFSDDKLDTANSEDEDSEVSTDQCLSAPSCDLKEVKFENGVITTTEIKLKSGQVEFTNTKLEYVGCNGDCVKTKPGYEFPDISWETINLKGTPKNSNGKPNKKPKDKPKNPDKKKNKPKKDQNPQKPKNDPIGERLPRIPENTDPDDGFKGENSGIPSVDPIGRSESTEDHYKNPKAAKKAIEKRKEENKQKINNINEDYANSDFKNNMDSKIKKGKDDYNNRLDKLSKILIKVKPKKPDTDPDDKTKPDKDNDIPPGEDKNKIKAARDYSNFAKEYLKDYTKEDKALKEDLVDFSDVSIEMAKKSYKAGNKPAGDSVLDKVMTTLDYVTDVIPMVSATKDAVTIATGKNPITGETVGDVGRAVLMASFFAPAFVSGSLKIAGKVLGKLSKSKMAAKLLKVIKGSDTFFKGKGLPCKKCDVPGEVSDDVIAAVDSGKWSKVFKKDFKPSDLKNKPVLREKLRSDKKIPRDWDYDEAKKQKGLSFHKPGTKKADEVRVMPGNPNSKYPNSRVPNVRLKKNGKYRDKNGKETNLETEEAHIPIDDFKFPDWM